MQLPTQDHIFIKGLETDALIGAYTSERSAPQRIIIDLDVGFDFQHAIQRDQLSDTLCYDHLVSSLRQMIGKTRYFLLETLADAICQHCIQQFQALWVRIRLYKPDILKGVSCIGVELTRQAPDFMSYDT